MVTGRAYRAKRRVAIAALECGYRLEARAGRVDRGFPGAGGGGGVRIERTAARRAHTLDLIEVGRGVHSFELGARRGARLEVTNRVTTVEVVETGQHRLEPLRSFRVPTAGIVIRKTRVCRHQQHEHRVPTHPRRYARPR
jgi:hypothetical protein